MIRGLLDLYEASLDEQWLEWAVALQAKLDELFWDSAGAGYYMATSDDPSILVRMKEGLKDLVSNSPFNLLYNSCNISSENLLLDQLIIC